MRKLFKYRPLSEFLFKELYYQELYFASYNELNDPLDLSARIDFSTDKEEDLNHLLKLIFKTTFVISIVPLPEYVEANNKKFISFYKDNKLRTQFRHRLFEQIQELKKVTSFISQTDIESSINKSFEAGEYDFGLNIESFGQELRRLSTMFLENSYATCFSETNNDFLMWSHYASKHSGICLEFSLENNSTFPYKMTSKRKPDDNLYKQQISNWTIQETIFWDRIKKVEYQDEQPFINFFDFTPVFNNEHDADLIGLSKNWTHGFAYELEKVFSTKTKPWSYENEWRAIEINFDDPQEPEKRIRHYPIEVLSAIYFGLRTPEQTKKRIYDIFKSYHSKPSFFVCKPTNGRELVFDDWENVDE